MQAGHVSWPQPTEEGHRGSDRWRRPSPRSLLDSLELGTGGSGRGTEGHQKLRVSQNTAGGGVRVKGNLWSAGRTRSQTLRRNQEMRSSVSKLRAQQAPGQTPRAPEAGAGNRQLHVGGQSLHSLGSPACDTAKDRRGAGRAGHQGPEHRPAGPKQAGRSQGCKPGLPQGLAPSNLAMVLLIRRGVMGEHGKCLHLKFSITAKDALP